MLGCVPPSFMLLLMCCMPETPRFLLTQHKRQEAMAAMQFLWGSEQGWEEPPVGAEHQVRGWEPELGGGDHEVSPLCSQGRSTQSVAKAVHTQWRVGLGVLSCVPASRGLLEPHCLAGPQPWTSLGKPEP